MRLLPQSSIARIALVIGAVIFVSQVISIVFFFINLYVPSIKSSAQLAAIQVRAVQDGPSQSSEQNELAVQLTEATGIRFLLHQEELPPEWNIPFLPVLSQLFEREMEKELGEPIEVRLQYRKEPIIWVQAESFNGAWLTVPIQLFRHYDKYLLFGWLMVFPIITLVTAYIVGRQLARPLNRLAVVTRRLGKGEHVPVLDDKKGSAEMNEVNQAFNKMAADMLQAQQDRALLLAGVSHDLRTPLTRMRLTAEFLGDEELRDGIIRDIEDMDAILDQFISFIRDGSDEMAEFSSINPVIVEVAEQFATEDINLDLGDVPNLSFKRLAIKRLLGNLVTNAIRYAGGQIHIRSSMEGRNVVISVLDNGPGVKEEQIAELLQPFSRGDKSRTTKGSGLGLAIVKRIAELHHGDVVIRNREEGGLEVKVIFPAGGEFLQPESFSKRVR